MLAQTFAPAAVALALMLAACAPTTQASDLPLPVVGLIQEELPGYHPPSTNQNDGRQIGWGDFDANGMDDVAMLLHGSDDWQLVVFRQLEGGSYRADVIEQFPGDDREFKRRFPAQNLELKTVAPGATLEVGGTVEEQDGNTTFVYEQFPQNLAGTAVATLATRRELVFHQTPIEQARALMREQPGYYRELTGDDDPAGFAPIDASLACQ